MVVSGSSRARGSFRGERNRDGAGIFIMPIHSSAYAYLVRACLFTSSGTLLTEPDTICFDLDLALEMAESDRAHAAGLAVYELGIDGCLLADCPLVSHGIELPAVMPSPAFAAAWA
jgi:hypothetical protein